MRWTYFALLSSLLSAGFVSAANRPEGSVAACKDGTFSDQATKTLACKGHKGVATWYGTDKAAVKSEPAVQTQSPKVSSTGLGPTTGEPSRTPAKP